MSKSYRRFPKITQEKEDHRYLNRQIRHDKLATIPKGGAYKKYKPHFEWGYRWSLQDAINTYHRNSRINDQYSLEEWIEYWYRIAVRK